MRVLQAISIAVLITAAFLNAAALGEQYGLKLATQKSAIYRVAVFAVDLFLAAIIARQSIQ